MQFSHDWLFVELEVDYRHYFMLLQLLFYYYIEGINLKIIKIMLLSTLKELIHDFTSIHDSWIKLIN